MMLPCSELDVLMAGIIIGIGLATVMHLVADRVIEWFDKTGDSHG